MRASRRLTAVEKDALRMGMRVDGLECKAHRPPCGLPDDWRDGTCSAGHEFRIDTAHVSAVMAMLGAKGGRASARKLTAKQRSDKARKAVKARWAKRRKGQ